MHHNRNPLPIQVTENRRLRNQLLLAAAFGVALGVSFMLLICWLAG